MSSETATILLIDRGDLPALAAGVIQPDTSRLILWHREENDPAGPRRAAAVEAHGNLLGPADLIVSESWVRRGVFGGNPDAALEESLMLVQAAIVARETGCAKIIWPVQMGASADRISAAVDRAATVVDLVGIGAGHDGGGEGGSRPGELVIDLPLVDLEDDQVVDLADDAGAPLVAFWPCEFGGEDPCGSGCSGCDRWRRAFADRGLPWPWIGVGSS